MELTLLEPDVATLISRGDSLVLQVQTSDLERALRINATTGDLRAARAALKAGNEVSCYCRHCLRDFSFLTTRRPLIIEQTQSANFASKQMATNSHHADCTLIIQKTASQHRMEPSGYQSCRLKARSRACLSKLLGPACCRPCACV